MKFRPLVVGAMAALLVAFVVHAQSGQPQTAPATPQTQPRPQPSRPAQPAAPVARPATAATTPAAPAITADAQRAFLNQYCIACHSEKMKAAGLDSARRLTVDGLDPANVEKDREKWELVVR